MTDDQKLAELRREIDAIDEKLVALLNDRARAALQIGIAKNGANVYQPGREKQVLKHISDINQGPLNGEGLEAIFTSIIEVCRTIQYNK